MTNFITGLAAPAIAQGLGALAPTLGSIVPAVGGGFAAAASATGSVAGSVTVAASFGGIDQWGVEHDFCLCLMLFHENLWYLCL